MEYLSVSGRSIMFENKELQSHLEESQTVRSKSAIIAEWNMNIPSNIQLIGNYRYRSTDTDSSFYLLPNSFDSTDAGGYYTGATDADIVIDGGIDDDDTPTTLVSKKDKLKTIYSLEDCFKPFRPRSGINKARYISGQYLHHPNMLMADRPRYYMPDKADLFKYWTSYRTEGSVEYGIANKTVNGQKVIDDAVPFVVYKNNIPTNRLVIKMQTHIGTVDLGTMASAGSTKSDPFYGESNKATPLKWKVQHLKGSNWVDTYAFDINTKREDGSPIIGADGYVELEYGLKIPSRHKDSFIFAEVLASTTVLPDRNIDGYAYLVKPNPTDLGTFYIWQGEAYETFTPEYGWQLARNDTDRLTNFVTDLTDPDFYSLSGDGSPKYREFEYIRGVRIVVESMTKIDSTFDLIEISPRLSVNITDKVSDFSINKSASDLGISGMPVGQLLASTGKVTIFDYDDSFNDQNSKSIIKDYIARNIQFKFYEVIVDVNGFDYFVPLKTLYSDVFPSISNADKKVTINLRDLFFYLESTTAPQILSTQTSVSSAVCLLLDYLGFSNYTFKRIANEKEAIIPYFFIPPDTSIAQVLQDIAISTQTAMFFDEYNNFVMMSKNYMLPSSEERTTSTTLLGTTDQQNSGVVKNAHIGTKLANIIEYTDQDSKVYNDGNITYNSRHIQRSIGSLKQASLIDNERTWIYKPVLLWEVAGTQNTKSVNGQVGNQSAYVLSAIPLNSDLSDTLPMVVNNKLVNNTMNFGEAVYWITRYNGYFYANGEMIKYDAVEYNVAGIGNVWITDVQEYEDYASKVPFNGKIYPTGAVRIYSEPNYQEISGVLKLKNGPVAKHGRGQFGTPVVSHKAGLDPYWSDNKNVRGVTMKVDSLFNSVATELPTSSTGLSVGAAGKSTFIDLGTPATDTPQTSDQLAQKCTRNGIIKNFLSSTYLDQSLTNSLSSTQSGTVQSSALVLNGPAMTTYPKPTEFISYVYKPLTDKFKHFGTRMRIIGKIENNLDRGQSAVGSSTYYIVPGTTPDKNISISGGSGGLAVMLNPETNNGYYFEIVAIGSVGITNTETSNVNNVFFYKILKDDKGNAVPVKLWEGLSKIIVDDGNFVGQYRVAAEENPTVYDLSVEYEDIGSFRRFYLYINNTLVKIVEDNEPLPVYKNMALFTRGSSRVMFENIFALANNYSQNTSFALDTPVQSIFDSDELSVNESFRKYAMSGIVQGTYLSGISTSEPPKYNMYFEEFGTIMREASTFNVKYDKAYPALYAKLSPTFNRLKGYTVSGFRAGSYGAEFLIFNATDTALSLDETTGNYLRIQGITFTQQSQHVLRVDDYFAKTSSMSDPVIKNDIVIESPLKASKDYEDIKVSRLTYGKKDFSLNVPYIQTQDDANDLMKWTISKIMKPRKSIGLKIFAMPTLQLGDLVKVDYTTNGVNKAGTSNYVIYNIEYSKDSNGPQMNVFLSEVS
jgi:hypothetical protein